MSERRKELFQKHWSIITALQSSRLGLTVKQLAASTAIRRSTLYRCMNELISYGLPIDSVRVDGAAKYRLDPQAFAPLPSLGLTTAQRIALHVARIHFAAFDGMQLASELDSAIQVIGAVPHESARLSLVGSENNIDRSIVRTIDDALHQNRQLRIVVSTRNQPTPHERLVDPLCLRWTGRDLYLAAHDHARATTRTFKVARVQVAEKLAERAAPHLDFDPDRYFENAVGVGTGPAVDVRVRFAPSVARRVAEYPIVPDQTSETSSDGSVVVHARVAGLDEVRRKLLAWGPDVEVLAPQELREAVARDHALAARVYRATPLRGVAKRGPQANARRGKQTFPRIVGKG